jgi:hypothetical protein
MAAVQAARMGKTVVLVAQETHLGGMTSGGLGATDIGKFGDSYVQGLTREFYERMGKHYGKQGAVFAFEPHVAEQVYNDMAREAGVRVNTNQWLAAAGKQGAQILTLTMTSGEVFRARMFVDATYEGDLMAKAGVSYCVDREANAQYGESLNGVRAPNTGGHQFKDRQVDPYRVPGEPASGLIPLIQAGSAGTPGAADQRVQAYNFRMCLTKTAANRLPITAPPNYDPATYELLARYIHSSVSMGASLSLRDFMNISSMPDGKTDINNNGPVSTDFIGQSDRYAEADFAARAKSYEAHKNYMQGFFYFLATDSRVPAKVRDEMQAYGLSKDEFVDNGGWPYQLYVREARRMVSDYVMTEANCLGKRLVPDSIGLGAYTMDSHNCARLVVNGRVENEGDTQVAVPAPYPISYRAIIPKANECENLLVPVCLSASHIAYGSIRMEPVYMILGQSAATAACLALDDKVSVQQLDFAKLQARLLQDRQKLQWRGKAPETGPGITMDNADATGVSILGAWTSSQSIGGYFGGDYLHNDESDHGRASVTFTPNLPQPGAYQVYARWTAASNRSKRVPIDIVHAGGTNTVFVDQTKEGGQWVQLLTADFNAGTNGWVRIRNDGTTGYVIADAVSFVPKAATNSLSQPSSAP